LRHSSWSGWLVLLIARACAQAAGFSTRRGCYRPWATLWDSSRLPGPVEHRRQVLHTLMATPRALWHQLLFYTVTLLTISA